MNAIAGSIAAVGAGAAMGAWLRWALGTWLNARTPGLPLGTLAANLIGAYAIGLAMAWFADRADIPAEWRLFVVTGLLGGLTTFSTFSAEAVSLLLKAQYAWAFAHSAVHLLGSLALTALGIVTYRAFA